MGFSRLIVAEKGQGGSVNQQFLGINAIVWYSLLVIHMDYLQEGKTIIAKYYANSFNMFVVDLK